MTLELTPRLQRIVALGVLGVLVALALWLFAWPLWAASSLHAEQVGMLKKQVLTMRSLADAAPRFEQLSKKLAANPEIAQLTYAAPQPALAVAQLQGQLSQIFATASGAVVTSSQPLPEVRDGALTKITVQSMVEGELKAVVAALHAIDTARPLLTVEKLVVRDPDGDWGVNPQPNAPNKLQVEIVVSAYMRVP